MPEAGDYLLSSAGFSSSEKPLLVLQKNGTFMNFEPLGYTIALQFHIETRFCVGWRDIATGECFPCPDAHTIEGKYEQCATCQARTGFNPAFYHASSVSPQQEARNQEPHILYLAHFGAGTVKVGISHAKRGNGRLLEQGARSAIILDTFPTAHIARQYEARIAAIPAIAETIQLRKKVTLLAQTYNNQNAASELLSVKKNVEALLATRFTGSDVQSFQASYFPDHSPALSEAYETTRENRLSGKAIGALGTILFCDHQGTPVFLPLKKYIGHILTLTYDETPLDLPARQMSLF